MPAEEKTLQFSDVNDDVVRSLTVTGRNYYIALGLAIFMTLACFFFPWFYQLYYGIAAAGNNHPAVWGTYLASFIFWIGLSHSGTLLSCVLHITNSSWRKSHVSQRRSDDIVLPDGCCDHGHGARWPAVVYSLGGAVSESDGTVAQFPFALAV